MSGARGRAVSVLVGTAIVSALAGCASGSATVSPTPTLTSTQATDGASTNQPTSDTPATVTSTQTITATQSVSIVPNSGKPIALQATISNPSQVAAQLKGTSAAFQAAVAAQVAKLAADKDCTDGYELGIDTYYPDSFATGSIFQKNCGGSQQMWFVGRDGAWRTFDAQSVPTCDELTKAGMVKPPAAAEVQCMSGDQTIVYEG